MNVGWRVSVTLMNSIDTLSKYTDTTRLESLAKDVIVSNPDNDSDHSLRSLEPASQEVSREKKLVIRLAEWSLKYPISTDSEDDEILEILAIEKEAKELLSEYNREDNKNT